MRLSAPIFRLKRQAKLLSRTQDIPLHQALNQIAISEGYNAWSHLAASATPTSLSPCSLSEAILTELAEGDMLLLAARPGHGKTLAGLEIAATAHRKGRNGLFFTLDYHEQDVVRRLSQITDTANVATDKVVIDTSDEICADHIIRRLSRMSGPSVAVIDYLQLLDQRRCTPELDTQLAQLQRHVQTSGDIVVVISQIDRSFEASGKDLPDLNDVRLPNPVDLSRFTRTCFLHDGSVNYSRVA